MGNIKPFTGQDGVQNALSTLSLKELYKQSAAEDSIGIKVSRKESVHQRNWHRMGMERINSFYNWEGGDGVRSVAKA